MRLSSNYLTLCRFIVKSVRSFGNLGPFHRSRFCVAGSLSSEITTSACCKFSEGNKYHIWPHYMSIKDPQDYDLIKDMVVYENFLTEDEENNLFEEVEPYMKRLHYEFDHWDDAIHGYRETERLKWNERNTKTIQKVRDIAFTDEKQLSLVHVLDLSEKGLIKPHIDSVRFCGDTIAGLSLLSDSVMRLSHEKEPTKSVDILLQRRSLYVMKGVARYDYTHEILGNDSSTFKGNAVFKSRRLSIICRNEPDRNKIK